MRVPTVIKKNAYRLIMVIHDNGFRVYVRPVLSESRAKERSDDDEDWGRRLDGFEGQEAQSRRAAGLHARFSISDRG
jgi:hypothetical protein